VRPCPRAAPAGLVGAAPRRRPPGTVRHADRLANPPGAPGSGFQRHQRCHPRPRPRLPGPGHQPHRRRTLRPGPYDHDGTQHPRHHRTARGRDPPGTLSGSPDQRPRRAFHRPPRRPYLRKQHPSPAQPDRRTASIGHLRPGRHRTAQGRGSPAGKPGTSGQGVPPHPRGGDHFLPDRRPLSRSQRSLHRRHRLRPRGRPGAYPCGTRPVGEPHRPGGHPNGPDPGRPRPGLRTVPALQGRPPGHEPVFGHSPGGVRPGLPAVRGGGHHRAQGHGRSPAPGQGFGRSRQPGQKPLSLHHEPRNPHAHEYDPRHGGRPAGHAADRTAATVPVHPGNGRRGSHGPAHRYPGAVQDRIRRRGLGPYPV